MAEPLFDMSAPVPRGRFIAPLNLDVAPLPSAPASYAFSNAVPMAKMTSSGLTFERGGEVMAQAKALGRTSAPVAMSMASARRAAAAGMLGRGASVANFTRGAEVALSAPVAIVIDLRDMGRLSSKFAAIAVGIQSQHSMMSMAINDGLRSLRTGLKRKLQAWTGIRQQKRVTEGFHEEWSTPATLAAKLVIKDRYIRITREYFGASWSRANPGGTHSAWNRSQLAVHSFMIPGAKPLFKRVGDKRFPIAPLWGPNVAREIERHEGEVERDVVTIARTEVLATAERLLANAIARAAG